MGCLFMFKRVLKTRIFDPPDINNLWTAFCKQFDHKYLAPKFFGSGAFSGKMLLVRIVEKMKLMII